MTPAAKQLAARAAAREERDMCSVADQHCEAPANLEGGRPPRGKCFVCGYAVCRMCSSFRRYYSYGRVRMCNNCQEEHDGSDRIVMQRLVRLAR